MQPEIKTTHETNTNKSSGAKVLAVLLFIVALAAAVFVIYKLNKNGSLNTIIKHETPPVPQPQFTQIDPATLPAGIPQDLPKETGAIIVKNYEGFDPNTEQKTSDRQYLSKKTVTENAASYEKYFKTSAWKLAAKSTLNGTTLFRAVRNGETLIITISPSKEKGFKSFVDITYVSSEVSQTKK